MSENSYATAYSPETYDFVGDLLRRFGEVDEVTVQGAAEGFAHARAHSRHVVFPPSPETEGVSEAMLAISTTDHGQKLVHLFWQADDGCVGFGRFELGDDAEPSLRANEAYLRKAAAQRAPTRRDKGASLSAHSASGTRFASEMAHHVYAEMRLGAHDVNLNRDRYNDRMAAVNKSKIAFHKIQSSFERKRLGASLMRFNSYLDPDALKILHQTGIMGTKRYNWLVGDGEPEKAKRRQQAARAYPLLFGAMSGKKLGSDVSRAIDAGEPLAPVLATALRCPESALKRLQGVHWQRAGRHASHNPGEVLSALTKVPGNWTPHARAEWAAFHAATGSAKTVSRQVGRSEEAIIKSSGGKWVEFASALAASERRLVGARDMLSRIEKQVILPEVARRMSEAGLDWADDQCSARSIMQEALRNDQRSMTSAGALGDKSLSKILQASDRWHRSLPRIDDAVSRGQAEEQELRWGALSASFTTPEGWTVTPLVTQAELQAEGDALSHCVGGYAADCVRHDTHILSIKDEAGKHVSTVELAELTQDDIDRGRHAGHDRIRVGERYLSVRQHQGYDNDEAEGVDYRFVEREAALKGYLEHLGQNTPDWEAIDSQRQEARRVLDSKTGLQAQIGFDPENAEVRQKVFEIYRESMIGPGRKAETPAAFLAAAGMQEAIDAKIYKRASELERAQSEDAAREYNVSIARKIKANAETDPKAKASDAMSLDEYLSIPEERRPGTKDVFFALPGEGTLRGLNFSREDDGKPVGLTPYRASEKIEDMLVNHMRENSFLRASLAMKADKHIVGFTKAEAEAYRDVVAAVVEQRELRAQGEEITLREALMEMAVRRSDRALDGEGYASCA
ncbi:hypothetical protein CKO28_06215 [Rhodovibrio sodomensis]|uniref:Large polyvalent protein-associated domain-containing protein n=1 Tax=Rhodovibrio sodomensis TaxID=1088 RepID=A0ABS1DCG4_9PROT|nr:PcfJ domain-containing protein [Rhodovibrio sodomensis]MBK1667627.1 hypothetical protein [Rhodovibrio sodomensis]